MPRLATAMALGTLILAGCTGTAATPSPAPTDGALTTFIPTAEHDRALAMTVTVPDASWRYDNIALGFGKGSDANDVPEALILLWSFPAGTEYWVYGDPCRWASTKPDVPATNADGIVAGLAGQASREASEVADLEMDGYPAKSVTLRVPGDAVFADCDSGYFASYGVTGDELTRTHQGPGQIDEFWVVDVAGAVAVIDAMYRADTPAAMVEQMRGIAMSIEFDAPPTASPAATAAGLMELPVDAQVEPGQYLGAFERYRFAVTVPNAGWTWTREYESFHQGQDHSHFAIFRPGGSITTLYAEACASQGTEFEVGPTVDDLANALASLKGFEVSDPVDITVSGYHGKRVRVTVPMVVDPANPECYEGYSLMPGISYAVAGQSDDMWIIDMNGTRLVPTIATGPETPAEVVDQAEAMLESLVLEPN